MARQSKPSKTEAGPPWAVVLDRLWPHRRLDPSAISAQSPYPLDRSDARVLDPTYRGTIYTWDIDKTYLDSEFHSAAELIRTALEFAIDKRAIAGTVPLLRAIRRGPRDGHGTTPLYFVSASPPQLRGVIERKMLLDGVEHDGITLKDQFALVKRGRIRQLREHVGYKLAALLLNRRAQPPDAREVLFGDDSESDAVIYSTYARISSGELRGDALERVLAAEGVGPEGRAYALRLSEDLPVADRVLRIFIHLATGRSIASIEDKGPLVRASRSPLQAALALWEMGEVDDRAVRDVVAEVAVDRKGAHDEGLDPFGLLEDAYARELVNRATADRWSNDECMS